MMMSITVNAKKRGRPAGRDFPETVAVRLKSDQVAALDAWRERQPDRPSRSEAMRQFLEKSLAGEASESTHFADLVKAFFLEDERRLTSWMVEGRPIEEAVQEVIADKANSPGPPAFEMLQALEGEEGDAAARLRAVLRTVAVEPMPRQKIRKKKL